MDWVKNGRSLLFQSISLPAEVSIRFGGGNRIGEQYIWLPVALAKVEVVRHLVCVVEIINCVGKLVGGSIVRDTRSQVKGDRIEKQRLVIAIDGCCGNG